MFVYYFRLDISYWVVPQGYATAGIGNARLWPPAGVRQRETIKRLFILLKIFFLKKK